MGIPRKGSRAITVRGHELRWLRKGGDRLDRLERTAPFQHDITVGHVDGGQILQFRIAAGDGTDWLSRNYCVAPPVTPGDVARIVEAALDEGWDPTAPGGPRVFTTPIQILSSVEEWPPRWTVVERAPS